MRTLLYVNLDFPPMSGPGIWRALGFVKYLPDHGWRTTVLCSDRSPTRDRYDPALVAQIPTSTQVYRVPSRFQGDIEEWMERIADRSALKPLAWFLRGVHWRFVRHYPDAHLHWACKVAALGTWIAARRKVDCLLTSGPPHISHVVGWMIKRATGLPWVMDYRDLWTDDTMQVKQNNYQPRLFARLEQAANARADAVVAVSPSFQAHLSQRFSHVKPGSGYHLIRNGHDLSDAVIERSLFRPCNERPHFHFNGTPQAGLRFGPILDLLDRLPRDRLPLFTFTGLRPRFQEDVARRGYQECVRDIGHMGHQQSTEYCMTCDVLMAMGNPTMPLYRGTIPGKVYEAMALGRHLLAMVAPGSDVASLIDDYQNGTLVNGDDVDDLHRGVLRILELHRTGQLNADQDPARRRAIADKYSRRRRTDELVQLLGQLLQR